MLGEIICFNTQIGIREGVCKELILDDTGRTQALKVEVDTTVGPKLYTVYPVQFRSSSTKFRNELK